jgi:hypothetical protein
VHANLIGYVCLTLHCRNATPLLVTFDLFAENFRLCRRQRHDLIGGVPVVLRQVEHVPTANGRLNHQCRRMSTAIEAHRALLSGGVICAEVDLVER